MTAMSAATGPSEEARESGEGGERIDPAPPIPPLVALAWDLLLLSVLAAYFFFVHSFTRGLLGDLGLSIGVAIKALVVMVALAGFILWIAPVTDLPRVVWRHRIPERRLARGECPRCGQRRAAPSARCPECGATPAPPPRWELSARPFLRFGLLTVVGIVLGGGLAEWRISVDERAFLAEVAARPDATHERPRTWPLEFARLQATPESRPTATGVLESPQEPGWRPRRPRDG
jgi:hypothetical protein